MNAAYWMHNDRLNTLQGLLAVETSETMRGMLQRAIDATIAHMNAIDRAIDMMGE